MLSNTTVIPDLHANIFSMTLSLQKGFQVMPEGEIKKNSTKIRFDKKMANKSSKGFLLTTKFHRIENANTIPHPEELNIEGKTAVHPEETVIN